AEIRHIFSKRGGSLGESGCVAWMFDKKGVITVEKDQADEEKLMEVALEAGAEDVRDGGEQFEVLAEPSDFETVRDAVEAAGIAFSSAEVTMVPQNTTPVEGRDAEKMVDLMEALDDCDDVQKAYTNADIPDEFFEG
ncbi:MAG: YebC/PmpR family DNA-binding transcriptional regulator, partial [Desulfococcaceae bacterium]